MVQKIIVLYFIIIFSLIIVGCTQPSMMIEDNITENTSINSDQQEIIEEPRKIDRCENKEKEARITCYTDEAFQKNDSSICDLINEKDSCYSALAVQKQELTLCERIADNQTKQACYLQLAIATQNVSICTKLVDDATHSFGGRRSSCYWFFAGTTNDNNYCEEISAVDARNACLRGEFMNG